MIQPSIERTATAPEEVCWSVVVEGLLEEPLRAGGGGEELSMSISLDAMFERKVYVRWVREGGRGMMERILMRKGWRDKLVGAEYGKDLYRAVKGTSR